MPRIKKTLPTLTIEDVVELSGAVAAASIALDADTAAMNKKIDAIRAAHGARQQELQDEITAKADQVAGWASANPNYFKDGRSLDLPRAIIGYRTGNPTVKTTKGVSVPDAIENLLRLEGGDQFVRIGKPSLDKDGIIRERNALADLFSKCGITVIQEERFYIEPKKDQPAEVDART